MDLLEEMSDNPGNLNCELIEMALEILKNVNDMEEAELALHSLTDATFSDLNSREVDGLSISSLTSGYTTISNLLSELQTTENAECSSSSGEEEFEELEEIINTFSKAYGESLELDETETVETENFSLAISKSTSASISNTAVEVSGGDNDSNIEIQFPDTDIVTVDDADEDYYLLQVVNWDYNPLESILQEEEYEIAQVLTLNLYSEASFQSINVQDLQQPVLIQWSFNPGISIDPNCTFYDSDNLKVSYEGMELVEFQQDDDFNVEMTCSTTHFTAFAVTTNPVMTIVQQNQVQTLAEVEALSSYEYYDSTG